MKKLSPKKKKTITSIAIVLSLTAVCGIVIYKLIPASQPPPDPAKSSSLDTASYIASTEFANLPLDKKVEYMETIRKSGNNTNPRETFSKLIPEERKKVMENMRPVMQEMMKKRVKQYFALKTKEERDKFLDEEVEKMKKMREAREKERQDQSQDKDKAQKPPDRQHGPRNKDEIKKRIENESPQDRAERTEYMKQIRARMHR